MLVFKICEHNKHENILRKQMFSETEKVWV